jgi:exodeoxyribonuclease VIII
MDKPYLPTLLDGDSYFTVDAVNQTLLKQVLKSPAHAREYLKSPMKPSAAMLLGTAVHTAMLEPEVFDSQVVVIPDINKRTKEGKLQWKAFTAGAEGKTILTKQQAVDCIQIGHRVARSDAVNRIVNSGAHEVSIGFEDEKTGLACKARIDILDTNGKHVVDIKTTADASMYGFSRSCAKFLYHLQAAFYLRAASGHSKGIDAYKDGWRFTIIAVETSAPYGVAIYKFDQRAICEGDDLVDIALKSWSDAKMFDEFDDYPDEVQELSLPAWALKEQE